MWNLNKQTKLKQTHRYREHFDGCQMEGGLEMGEEGEGIRIYKLPIIKTVIGI